MGVINLPGISGNVTVRSANEGTVDSPISGWIPIIEVTPWRKKIQFLRDNGALIRYEIDKEGPHIHLNHTNGFKIKIHVPQSHEMSLEEFKAKVLDLKNKGNGLINSLRRKKDKLG